MWRTAGRSGFLAFAPSAELRPSTLLEGESVESPEARADGLISALFDAQARQRIATAYVNGWVTAEDALNLLLSCDLLEGVGEDG